MPESPLISVIVPVYNVEKYLRNCLDSICGQTFAEVFFDIVDWHNDGDERRIRHVA